MVRQLQSWVIDQKVAADFGLFLAQQEVEYSADHPRVLHAKQELEINADLNADAAQGFPDSAKAGHVGVHRADAQCDNVNNH